MIIIVSSAGSRELSLAWKAGEQSLNRQTLPRGLLRPGAGSDADSEHKLSRIH